MQFSPGWIPYIEDISSSLTLHNGVAASFFPAQVSSIQLARDIEFSIFAEAERRGWSGIVVDDVKNTNYLIMLDFQKPKRRVVCKWKPAQPSVGGWCHRNISPGRKPSVLKTEAWSMEMMKLVTLLIVEISCRVKWLNDVNDQPPVVSSPVGGG